MAHIFTRALYALSAISIIDGASSQIIAARPHLKRADYPPNATSQVSQTSPTSSNGHPTAAAETYPVIVVAVKTDAPEADVQHFQATLQKEFNDGLTCAMNSTGFPMYCKAPMKPDQIREIAKSTNVYSALFPDMTLTIEHEVIWEDKSEAAGASITTTTNATQKSNLTAPTDIAAPSGKNHEKNGNVPDGSKAPDADHTRRSAGFHKREVEVQPDSPIELKIISQKKQGPDGISDYLFDSSAGQNITVYYISLGSDSDCIASKISSRDYGVAKLANVTAVTVSDWTTPVAEQHTNSSGDAHKSERKKSKGKGHKTGGKASTKPDGDSHNDSPEDHSPDDPNTTTRRSTSPSSSPYQITLSDFGHLLTTITTSITTTSTQGNAVVHIGPGLHIDASSFTALDWLKSRVAALAALDVPIVVAAGDAGPAAAVDTYPALFAAEIEQMVVVGAADARSGGVAASSQLAADGAPLAVFAPGTGVQCAAGGEEPGARSAAGTAVAAAQVAGLAAYFLALPGSNIPPLGSGERALWVRSAIEEIAYERVPGGPRIIHNGL